MLVNLGNNTIWEVIPLKDSRNKAILRTPEREKRRPMTIPMDGYEQWLYDNLEDLQNIPDYQTRIIYAMQKWGQSKYEKVRESKIIFS
jgi:hypothetical protein